MVKKLIIFMEYAGILPHLQKPGLSEKHYQVPIPETTGYHVPENNTVQNTENVIIFPKPQYG
jgi:hypothetical protein